MPLTPYTPPSFSPNNTFLMQHNPPLTAPMRLPLSPPQSLKSGQSPKSVRSYTAPYSDAHDAYFLPRSTTLPNAHEYGEIPAHVWKAASEAAAKAAAEAAAKVAAEYFEAQNSLSNMLPSRPVSPSSETSMDEKWIWSYSEDAETRSITPTVNSASGGGMGVAIDDEQLYDRLANLHLESQRPQSPHSSSTVQAPKSPLSFTKRTPAHSTQASVSSISHGIAAEAEQQQDAQFSRSSQSSSFQSQDVPSSCSSTGNHQVDESNDSSRADRPDKEGGVEPKSFVGDRQDPDFSIISNAAAQPTTTTTTTCQTTSTTSPAAITQADSATPKRQHLLLRDHSSQSNPPTSPTTATATTTTTTTMAEDTPAASTPVLAPSTPPQDPQSATSYNNSAVWSKFYAFASSTRHSDSLVYALARKEAFFQNKRLTHTSNETADLIDLWIMMALRFTLKGKLLFSPVSSHIYDSGGTVLDIQGIFRDQWTWQMALDFPNAMIYGYKLIDHTLVRATDSINSQNSEAPANPVNTLPNKYHVDSARCPAATASAGPANYIRCLGHTLTYLPFEDNTFDVISAKSLWYYVSVMDLPGALSELYRVLKPGGYVEVVYSDFAMLNGSPSDEYWWTRLRECVRAKGLDPRPSSRLPAALYNAGFADVNRALIALPRGWGGQTGHLTDLLSIYYSESMFRTFSDLTLEELDDTNVGTGRFASNTVTLVYARK